MRLKITTPGREFEQTLGDGKQSVVIGNRALDDITIEDDPEVSGPHVRIEKFAGKWSFTDQFSGAGTIHNGEKKYNGDLAVGDVLKLGGTEVRVLSFDSAAGSAESPQPKPRQAKSSAEVENVVGWIMRELDPDDLAIVQARPDALATIRSAAEKAVVDLQTEDEVEIRLEFDVPGGDMPVYLNADLYPKYLHKVAPPYDEDEDWEPEPPKPAENPKAKPGANKPVENREPPSKFVERIAERLIREFEREHGFDPTNDQMAKARLLEAARKAVIELDTVKQTQVNLPFLAADSSGPKHLDVTIERKHLHEDVSHSKQFPDESPAQAEYVRRKNREVGRRVALVVGISIGLTIAMSIVFDSGLFEGSEEQPVSVSEAPVPDEDDGSAELELQKKVQALMQADDALPQELLDRLDAYEQEARTAGYRIGWDYERCRTHLEIRVHREVSLRYNDTAGTVYDLAEARNYRQAEKNVDDLRSYLARSPHNQRAIEVLELDETIQRWSENHKSNSREFVAEQLLIMQEAISRDDFAPAVEALGKVIDGALLDDRVIRAGEEKLAKLKTRTGEARKPFHYRDRPPKSPENALLPRGDSTGYSRLNAHESKVVEAIRAGEVREFEVWGMHVIAEGEQTTSQLTMTYMLELTEDVGIEGVDRSSLANLPDDVRMALLLADEQLGADALSGMLVYAFDNGLFTQAGEVAYRLRRTDPEKNAQLDEILAVKWNTPVPEGGFPERDGRVVRE